jgi:hypothetical protein
VSEWLTCPEKSRLRALGVKRRGEAWHEEDELSALDFGSLCHFLRAIRVVHGHDKVEATLDFWRHEIPAKSWLKARFLFRTYESMFPRELDPMEYLAVEAEVVSDVGRALELGRSILRSVRYDTVVRVPGVGGSPAELFSFEAKTMARGGQGSVNPYMGQAMTQAAICNANPALVARYGRMAGVIFDGLLKTTTPDVVRYGPYYFGRVHNKLALRYLSYADSGDAVYGVQPDGTYPKFIHACWGRWAPCDYIALCHEESFGEYENADGSSYEGARP